MKRWEQLLCYCAALLLIAPGLTPTLIGAAITLPMLLRQIAARKTQKLATAQLQKA
jgi:UPF0716 family protein affecting phage T7 exclusion